MSDIISDLEVFFGCAVHPSPPGFLIELRESELPLFEGKIQILPHHTQLGGFTPIVPMIDAESRFADLNLCFRVLLDQSYDRHEDEYPVFQNWSHGGTIHSPTDLPAVICYDPKMLRSSRYWSQDGKIVRQNGPCRENIYWSEPPKTDQGVTTDRINRMELIFDNGNTTPLSLGKVTMNHLVRKQRGPIMPGFYPGEREWLDWTIQTAMFYFKNWGFDANIHVDGSTYTPEYFELHELHETYERGELIHRSFERGFINTRNGTFLPIDEILNGGLFDMVNLWHEPLFKDEQSRLVYFAEIPEECRKRS